VTSKPLISAGFFLSFAVFLSWSVTVSFLGFVTAGVRCDDGCHDGTYAEAGNWSLLEDAWQWEAIGWLAGANLVAFAVLIVELLVGARGRTLFATFAVQVAAVVALTGIVLSGAGYGVGETVKVLALAAISAPIALVLEARRRPIRW
jgi:hypothetical protein